MMGPLVPSTEGESSAGASAGAGRLDVGDLVFAQLPSPSPSAAAAASTHKKMTPKATTPAPPSASLQGGASRSGARSGAGATAVQSPSHAVLRSPLPQSPQPRDARGLPTPRATTDGKRRKSLLMTGASPLLSSPAGGAHAGGAMASPSVRLDRSRAMSPRGVPSALASPLPTSPAAIALAVIPSAPSTPAAPAPPPRATPAPRSRHTSARRTPVRDENHAFAGDDDAVPLSQSVDLPPLWGAAEAPLAGSIVLLKTVPARAETAEALGVPHFLSPVRRSVRKGGAGCMRSDSLESAGGAWAGNPALPGVSLTAGYADAAAPVASSAMKRSGFFVKRAGAAGSESAHASVARLPLGMSALQPLDVSLGPPIELTQMNI